MWGLSLRGWHIIGAGLIWLTGAILTFMNLFSTIVLGVIFILLAVITIGIGMIKIVRYERYEKLKNTSDSGTAERPMREINGQHPYSTFGNGQEVNVPVDGQEELDPNDPNIRFSKKYQNQLKMSN